MTTIKAIETKYKGYRFRSRLEARWAVFFDAMEIKWEYEKEGYDLGEVGWYLPDFWLSNYSWAEIKPKSILQDAFWKTIDQCSALAFQSNHPVALISGDPWPNEYTIMYFPHDCGFPACGTSKYQFDANGCLSLATDVVVDNDLINAYNAARSARFEHGEKPNL